MEFDQLEQKIREQEDMLYRISLSILKNKEDAKDAVHDAILISYEKIGTLKNEKKPFPLGFAASWCAVAIKPCGNESDSWIRGMLFPM